MSRRRNPFRLVVADCPWKFGDALPGPGRGAKKHYPCMTIDELCTLAKAKPLTDVADDAALIFWRVGSMQAEALQVIDAWGFCAPTSDIVWVKMTNDGERVRIGMGRTVRNCHEVALICKRGRPEVLSHSIPSVFHAPRGRHSSKPDAFYKMCEALFPGPRLEMFARTRRRGWTSFGNEIT